MRLVLGIDPGVTGACAAIGEHGEFVAVFDLPVCRDGKLAWVHGEDFRELLSETRSGRHIVRSFVERPQHMPGQGGTSSITIGAGIGSLLATLQVSVTPWELVTPGTWKRALGLGPDKNAARDRARALFPTAPLERKGDHNRAEALLLAAYGLSRLHGLGNAPEREFASWGPKEIDR
jgi:crossover junction endodeoxyribonuclease RuvC